MVKCFMLSQERFLDARRRAQWEEWLARLRGRSDELIPYERIAQALQSHEHGAPVELRSIPLDCIVGSVGRYHDFTRTFLPRPGVSADRWVKIDAAFSSLEGVPPIEVYQVGDVYFVSDGNHRVSVARANGFKEIEAYVTPLTLEVDAGLEPGDTLDQAIIKAECAHFVVETHLADQCRDLVDICFTRPGGYPQLLEHIEVHRYFMELDHPERPQPSYLEAAADWYANVYRPISAAIERQQLLRYFPAMTTADLYVWVSGRIFELNQAYGVSVSPDEAAAMLAAEVTPEEQRATVLSDLVSLLGSLAARAAEVLGSAGERQTDAPVQWVAFDPESFMKGEAG
jgi:hypothetical protein